MAKPELLESTRLTIDEAIESELLSKALQLAQRSWSFVEIHKMGLDSAFGKEAQRLASVRALLHAEDLNFHRSRSAVIDPRPTFIQPLLRFVSNTRRSEYTYRPAWWVRGPHAQTLWGKFFRPRMSVFPRVERWDTPDGDFLDLHRLNAPADAPPDAPRLLVLHGLEGSIRSHYVTGFFGEALRRGWAADLLVFRGCGSEPNRAPRFYHSGETSDLAFVLGRLLEQYPTSPIVLAGVSLGGNVLLKYLGERGGDLPPQLRGAAAISVPFDLERGARFIAKGFSRVYDRHFLRTLRQKALAKLERYPELFHRDRLERAKCIYDFDDVVTAPVHGFADAHDYYARSSSLGWLDRIQLPTLLLSAMDDPFLPADVLDEVREAATRAPALNLEFTKRGGHVGFIAGRWPWRPFYYAEWRACEFLNGALKHADHRAFESDTHSVLEQRQ